MDHGVDHHECPESPGCHGWYATEPKLQRCYRDLITLPDALKRISVAASLLSANHTSDGLCGSIDDVAKGLQRGGFVVLRNITDMATTVHAQDRSSDWHTAWVRNNFYASIFYGNTRSGPQVPGGPSVVRVPIESLLSDSRALWDLGTDKLARVIHAADRQLSQMRLPDALRVGVTGELFHVEPHHGGEALPELHVAQALDWHSDIDNMLWIMLERAPHSAHHGSLEVVPHERAQQLCALATDVTSEQQRGARRSARPGDAATIINDANTSPAWPTSLFDPIACSLRLLPGDGVLIRSGVYHRTQDYLARRTAVTLDLHRKQY